MFGFPASTEFGKRIPKQKFYENIDITPDQKRLFIKQIHSICWQCKLAATTLNLAAGSTVTEVLVIGHDEPPGKGAHDPLGVALQDLTAPIPEDADAETLEAHRLQLVEGAKKLASMRRLSEAYQREMDRAVGGSPAPNGPSRLGAV